MKTLRTSINQPLLRWSNGLSGLLRFSLPGSPWKDQANRTQSSGSATSNNSRSGKLSRIVALVVRAAAALSQYPRLLTIRNQGTELAKAFPRVFLGLVCLVVLAPYADVFYTTLDFNDRVSPKVWYYESYHWLFLCLGPYLKGIFNTIAFYLIFNARGSIILAPIAAYSLMFDVGKILWLLQVTNHDEYKSLPTNWFLAYGFVAGLFLVLMLDRLTFWFNHRVMAIKARLHGLRNIAENADPQIIVAGFVKTMDDDLKIQQFKS